MESLWRHLGMQSETLTVFLFEERALWNGKTLA